jgi:hypothetical protein
MIKSILTIALGTLALAVASPAFAGYPTTYAAQGGRGVASRDVALHFVAYKQGDDTRLTALRTPSGALVRSVTLTGAFGVPMLGNHSIALGMFRDGTTFVLQSVAAGPETTFQLVGTDDLAVRDTITLRGAFAFDALSPDGGRLYLVQHRSEEDFEHYVVRAYDLRAGALLAGRVADKAQRSWLMHGFPTSRVETANGRWVYTLYSNPSGFPFVHALDTVRGVAHCVGVGWKGSQDRLFDYRLAVQGNRLLVLRNDRSVYRVIDRTTWAVRRP